MKDILITMLCLGVTFDALSTNDSIPAVNFYLGVGGGRISQGEIFGLNATLLKQGSWGLQLKCQSNLTLSKQLPLDYTCSIYYGSKQCGREDILTVTSLKFIRQFLTSSKRLRFGLEVGPSLVSNKIAQFKSGSFYYTSSDGVAQHQIYYNTSYIENNAIGLDLSAKVELPLLTFFGVELGMTSNINKFKSFLGYELIFNFGLVRNRSKKVK